MNILLRITFLEKYISMENVSLVKEKNSIKQVSCSNNSI